MPNSDMFVSVVAPVRNASIIVEDYIRSVMKVLEENYTNFELILIDDDSSDDTVDKISLLLKEYQYMRLIILSKHFGDNIAISAGLDSAIGDYIVVMIPNTDPPDIIPEMINEACSGFDMIIGLRNKNQKVSFLIKLGTKLFYWYCKNFLKLNLPQSSTNFLVLSRKVVKAFIKTKDRMRYLRIISSHVGYRSKTFLYNQICRDGNNKVPSFFESLDMGINIIIKNSRHPLRFVSWFGIIASIINLSYAGFVLISYFFGDDIASGWTTLSLQNATMFFFIFLIFTVISEYVGHIIVELEDRPLYYVTEERSSSDLHFGMESRNVVNDTFHK